MFVTEESFDVQINMVKDGFWEITKDDQEPCFRFEELDQKFWD